MASVSVENTPQTEFERLGYIPDESSDCTALSSLDLKQKQDLLRWKYLEGGHKLPIYIPKIPHVDETEIFSSVMQDEAEFAELARRLAGDAKQIMTEYVYAKQRFDTLIKERDLLKWHIASNSKVMKLKEAEAIQAEARIKGQDVKLQESVQENERLSRELIYLSTNYRKDAAELDTLLKSMEEAQKEQEAWLDRRGDYIADTTLERRQANHERKLRYRQWKKLARACAVDKKWHVRIDAVRNADNMVFDAYESTENLLAFEFDKANDTTGPIRDIILPETDGDNPLEDFQTVSGKKLLNVEN